MCQNVTITLYKAGQGASSAFLFCNTLVEHKPSKDCDRLRPSVNAEHLCNCVNVTYPNKS